MSTAGPTEEHASNRSAGWGIALLAAGFAVGVWGGLLFPGRVRYVVFVGLVLAAFGLLLGARGRGARGASEPALEESELVAVIVVPNPVEAMSSAGCCRRTASRVVTARRTSERGAWDGMPGGPQQIFVLLSDVERARDLLARAR